MFVKDDLTNMFGMALRSEGLKNVLNDPNCSEFHRVLNMEAYPETNIYYVDAKGKMQKAPWKYSEGGQQGATAGLVLACAAIQPYIEELDIELRRHGGSARKGIDDGVSHGPPEILFPLLETYYRKIEAKCGLFINRSSSMVYSPTGNYNHMPPTFSIGHITTDIGPPQQRTQTRAEGLEIWGAAISADSNYIEGKLAIKAERVCSTITKIITTLNPINHDLAMTILRLSLYSRLQYSQQCQRPDHMTGTNQRVQDALDRALTDICGIDINDPASFSLTPETLPDPSIVADTMTLPTKSKGMGIRRMTGHRGQCAYIGGWHIVANQCFDTKDEDGTVIREGLYPLLGPLLGADSQDPTNEDRRWTKFIDGNSVLGNQFKHVVESLATLTPGTEGPLAYSVQAIRPKSRTEGKLQQELTKQIDKSLATQVAARYDALPRSDRRRIAHQHRQTHTMACFTTSPTTKSQVPQSIYTGCFALLLGAIDPAYRDLIGATIGDKTQSKVDTFGDALGTTVLPGDRWRISHDAFKDRLHLDGCTLGLSIQQERYGLFTRFMSIAGQDQFNQESIHEKKKKTIVPDLVTQNHPPGSILFRPGIQMWELKRVQAHDKFNRFTGASAGPNAHYAPTRNPTAPSGANHRADQIPKEYEDKAKQTDNTYGSTGQTSVTDALRDMATVRGLAIGAFGEFSDSIHDLIKGMAYEGSIKNAELFGTTDMAKAQSMISWWLTKRWNRLSVISTVQMRYDALRYVGGTAQQQAAANHTRLQAEEDEYVQEETRRFRDRDAMHHY